MLNYANNNNNGSSNITALTAINNHSHPPCIVTANYASNSLTNNTVNMKMSKLSNQTNSQDPQAVNSRIFVGNLNTFQCSKTDVERMFQIYGRLAGISMHKGYAFVQFTNPFDARNACLGEDGKMVLSQTLDVNMVAEPKAHQVGRKRQNVNKTGNDWDYFYDSYYSSTMNRSSNMRPKKRKRLMSTSSRIVSLSDAVNSSNINAAVAAATMAQQQQQLVQHQHQQQQHHHHHQQQQQAAAVAMAAMANLLPQQQMLLHHQQSLLSNSNGTAGIAAAAAAACNGATTTPHHASLNMYLQQQQQHQQIKQQQQQAAAAAVAAAQYAAVTNGGLQLKMSSPLMTGAAGQATGNASSAASLLTHDGEQLLATTTTPTTHHQTQLLQQQQQQTTTHLMQPLTLTLSPQQNQQQQQQQHHHHQQHQIHHHHQQQQQQKQQQHQQTLQQQIQDQLASNQQWGPFKVYSNPDTLICGNCRECFNELAELLDHKRSYCKLRFTCKCQDITTVPSKNPTNGAKLLCAVCKDAFTNPWDLMVHAQAAHMVNIYELGTTESNNNNTSSTNNNNNSNSSSADDSHMMPGEEVTAEATLPTNEPNNSLDCNNDTNNNNTKNHNGITMSRETICFSVPGKIQQPTQSLSSSSTSSLSSSSSSSSSSTMANVNGSDVGLMSTANDNGCNGIGTSELGHTSDTEAHLELKFGICNSPIGTINNKEELTHRDDTSLDGRMSDDIKMIQTNGSVSSRGSSPALDNDDMSQPQPRACIVRTLSIEATTTSVGTTPTTSATLGLIPTSLALSLNNSAASQAAAALAPQ